MVSSRCVLLGFEMPNWSDDEGRFWWTPPGKMWYDRVEVPHPPVVVMKKCSCDFCEYERKQKKPRLKDKK